ncbi:MAG: pyrimidine 5'-nucleotidase [Pseudomonadota bacterium]
MPQELRQHQEWVFDLDNTLYPASFDLFAQIDVRMTEFVASTLSLSKEAARKIQKQYYAEYGTTLAGLMKEHNLKPNAFLDYVHDIDHSPLPSCDVFRARIEALPGRKFVFTNGSRGHAEGVTESMGLAGVFDGMFGIEDTGFQPKPSPAAFDRFTTTFDIDPVRAVFFEDLSRNLAPAKSIGFTTVLVHSDKDWSHEPADARPAGAQDGLDDHVDYATDDLQGFLESVLGINDPSN